MGFSHTGKEFLSVCSIRCKNAKAFTVLLLRHSANVCSGEQLVRSGSWV